MKKFIILFFIVALHSRLNAQLQLIDPVSNTVALAAYDFVLPEIDSEVKFDFNVKEV